MFLFLTSSSFSQSLHLLTFDFAFILADSFSSTYKVVFLLGHAGLFQYISVIVAVTQGNNATQEVLSTYGYMGFAIAIKHIASKLLEENLVKTLIEKNNQMQRTLDVKDTYCASMIHELRNPLNAVLGSLSLLKFSKNLSKEEFDILKIASTSGEILITLINNALDGAKIEANKLELDPHFNDIVETLSKAVNIF